MANSSDENQSLKPSCDMKLGLAGDFNVRPRLLAGGNGMFLILMSYFSTTAAASVNVASTTPCLTMNARTSSSVITKPLLFLQAAEHYNSLGIRVSQLTQCLVVVDDILEM
jgi:hypothetical protein